jgi:hypothetical protein
LESFPRRNCCANGIELKRRPSARVEPFGELCRQIIILGNLTLNRLDQLQRWGLIDRQGRRYHVREKTLNSLIGMQSYQQVRRILGKATEELAVLHTLPV